MKTAIKEFKTHRSLEENELDNITSSLSVYDRVREDIEMEIHQLQKKTLVLQQEVNNRDDIISKLESANRILANSNANSNRCCCNSIELNSSGISAIPLTTRPTDQSTIKKIAHHIRKKNLSQDMSETKNIGFRTPEIKSTYIKESNEAHTAEILKNPQLDIHSNDSLIEHNGKVIDLSDILQTPEDDNSGFQNLLEDEILSSELASLSNHELDNMKMLDDDEESHEEIPELLNRAQSMPDPAAELKLYEEMIHHESKFLNMSLGDIPEEHEENATLSEKNPSSLDKYGNTISNMSSK